MVNADPAEDVSRVSPDATRVWAGAGCALQILGLPVGIATGSVTTRLVAAAWTACDDLEPGGVGFLWFIFLPAIALAAWIAFGLGTLVAFRFHPGVRLALGLTVVLLVGLVAVSKYVPAYGEDGYAGAATPALPECGPSGIPTWWPAWLPH